MNKPILAAVTGVTFGLFLGGLAFSHFQWPTCQRQAVRSVETTHIVVPTARATMPCPRMQESADEAPDLSDDDSVLSYAQTLYVNGEYEKAIAMAKRVDRKGQPNARSARIQGAAACNLRNTGLVEQAYRRLDAPGRQYLVYVCQRSGVTMHGRHFRLSE